LDEEEDLDKRKTYKRKDVDERRTRKTKGRGGGGGFLRQGQFQIANLRNDFISKIIPTLPIKFQFKQPNN